MEGGKRDAKADMVRVASREKVNALGAIPIYQMVPWLDLAERTDGQFSRCTDMISTKLDWFDSFLATAGGQLEI